MSKLDTVSYAYGGVTDRLQTLTYPGGTTANYSYFPNSQDKRLQEIKNQMSTSVLLSQFDYTYDAEGELQTLTKNYLGLTAPQRYDLGYDNADQLLTSPLKDAASNALVKQYTYGYDLAANRTSERVATKTTTSTPNNVNELTSQSGATTRTLSYDLNGNLTSDGGTRSFEWDGANRLVAINYTGTSDRSEFTYDGLSRLVKIVEKTGSTVNSTKKFVWCGSEKCETRDASDALTLRIYAQGQFANAKAYFYTRDHLGSVREMVDGTGTVQARFDYDPWGRSTTVINTNKPDFNFTGLYRHNKSGLDLATYRFYDPDLGRWLSRDPIGEDGGLNLYGYVGNDPINAVDPLGLSEAVFDRGNGTITVTTNTGQSVVYSAGNNTVNPTGSPNQVGSNGPAPNGTYPVQPPVMNPTPAVAYGPVFYPVGALGPNGERQDIARQRGIGIHGGREGFSSPTHGCIRMNNQDITNLTNLLRLLNDPLTRITIRN